MTRDPGGSWIERLVLAAYSAALRLYPPGFRRAFRSEMREAFRAALRARHRRRGAWGLAHHLVRSAGDLVVNIPAEWLSVAVGATTDPDHAAPLEVARDELRAVARGLRRSPGLVAAVVPTLAVGIGALTAFFSLVDAQLFRPLPYPEPDRLVRVTESGRIPTFGRVSSATLDAVSDVPSLEAVGVYLSAGVNLRTDTWIEAVRATRVDAFTLDVLGVRPLLGRSIAPDDVHRGHETVILLGHEVWTERFQADPGVLGSTVVVDGEEARVVGVMPEGFAFPDFADAILPFRESADEVFAGGRGLPAIARLADGVSFERAAVEVDALGAALTDVGQLPADARLVLDPDLVNRTAGLSFLPWVVLGTGFAVLLVVCSNVASVLLARGARRRAEIAVRASLGASASRLIAGSLLEGLVLALLGGGLGLLLAHVLLHTFLAALGANFPAWLDPSIDSRAAVFTLGAAVLSVLAFGFPAALEGARTDPAGRLASSGSTSTGSRRGRRLRGGLVAVEIALSLLLVTAGALMVASVLHMGSIDTGRDDDEAYRALLSFAPSFESPQARRTFLERAVAQVEALPGIESVGIRGDLVTASSDEHRGWVDVGEHPVRGEGGEAVAFRDVRLRVADPGYLETVGLELLRGRGLEPTDTEAGAPVAVVSATLAGRLWPEGDALGRRIRLGGVEGPEVDVVGVVEDERVFGSGGPRSSGFGLTPSLDLYLAGAGIPWSSQSLYVRPRTGIDGGWTTRVRDALRASDPDLAVMAIEPLGATHAHLRRAFGAIATLLVGLAAVGAGLAVLGVWGAIARSVAERTREIGIRTAIGGSGATIVREIMARGLRSTAWGLAAGLLLVLATTRVLRLFLYDVDPLEPSILVGTTLAFALVGLVAAWLPARRAASIDPMRALRAE